MKLFLTTSLLVVATSMSASAQSQLQKLLPNDPANWTGFGNAVALDGDLAVVGASTKQVNGLNYAGGVYVFRRQGGGGFVQEARILRPNPEIHDNFGASVAVQGDLMVAGAPDFPYSSFTGVGAAHVYRYVGGVWQQEAELHGSTAHVDSGFGTTVALDGNRILVGANLTSGGCCYVFEFNGISWSETAKFQAPSGGFHFDGYARDLALQDEVALVGARRLTVNGHFNAGKAFVYRHAAGAWNLETELTAPVPDDNEYFGDAVALDGNLIAIGLPPDNSVCLYRQSGSAWPFEIRFKNFPYGGDFGSAVAVYGDEVLVGAPSTGFFANYAGAVHPYRRSGGVWDEDPPFVGNDTHAQDGFGAAVALRNGIALISSGQDEPGYLGLGCVYVMDTTPRLALELNPNPPESGEDLDLKVRYGTPQTATWVAFSLRGAGSTFVPPLHVVLGIRNPKPLTGPSSTDAQGSVDWTIPMPLSASGRSVWFQALQDGIASNVVAAIVI